MQRLFKEIRHKNIDEVKKIIEKESSLVNCISGKLPKKDESQSPLMVATKIGCFEICYYLIEKGADVNFMEPLSAEPYRILSIPVLFVAINAVMQSLCYERYLVSDEALKFVKCLLEKGADPNKQSSHGMSAVNNVLFELENILKYYKNSHIRIKAKEQSLDLLNYLVSYGVDIEKWLDEGHYPLPDERFSNRYYYFELAINDEIGIFVSKYYKTYNCLLNKIKRKLFAKK